MGPIIKKKFNKSQFQEGPCVKFSQQRLQICYYEYVQRMKGKYGKISWIGSLNKEF